MARAMGMTMGIITIIEGGAWVKTSNVSMSYFGDDAVRP